MKHGSPLVIRSFYGAQKFSALAVPCPDGTTHSGLIISSSSCGITWQCQANRPDLALPSESRNCTLILVIWPTLATTVSLKPSSPGEGGMSTLGVATLERLKTSKSTSCRWIG